MLGRLLRFIRESFFYALWTLGYKNWWACSPAGMVFVGFMRRRKALIIVSNIMGARAIGHVDDAGFIFFDLPQGSEGLSKSQPR